MARPALASFTTKRRRADLYSVRIFDESLQSDSRLLVAAIEWALDQDMDIINLSLGTTEVTYRGALERICRQTAIDQGVLLVARRTRRKPGELSSTFAPSHWCGIGQGAGPL